MKTAVTFLRRSAIASFLILSGTFLVVAFTNCGIPSDPASSTPGPGQEQPANVPSEFKSLYDELRLLIDQEISATAQTPGTRHPVTRGATALSGNCNNGTSLLTSVWRDAVKAELNALKGLGVQEIVVSVCYPLLTPQFHDPTGYLDFYKFFAAEVRSRGLSLAVEHNSILPTFAGSLGTQVQSYYSQIGFTKTRFGQERFEEVKKIVTEMNPDYLTLVSEPNTHTAGLAMTVSDWKSYVQGVAQNLPLTVGSTTTKLGAGSGTWDSFDYINEFARIPNISFIDIHLYPVKKNTINYFDVLKAWPDQIRAINPNLKITMSEIWLYKSGVNETTTSVVDQAIFARDIYDFWAPLDQGLIKAVYQIASLQKIDMVAPFWSRYFFAYIAYGDPATEGKTAIELLGLASSAAFQAILQGQRTSTGTEFSKNL